MTLYPSSATIPIYAVFTGVGIVLTILRFWIRFSYDRQPFPRNPLGADDYFIFIGLLVVCACTGIQFQNAIHGNGGNAVSKENAEKQAIIEYKIDFCMIVVEKIAFGAIKLSLLFWYQRMFNHWPSFRRINNALIGFVGVWTLAFFMSDLLLCGRHIELEWALDQMLARHHCGEKGALLIAFAATSVLTDALVLGLPLVYIRRLQMRRGKKIAASLVFLLGGVSTLAGVLRLIFLCVASPTGRLTFGYEPPPHSKEPTILRIFNPTFWAMMEMLLGVWAANLPALAPLFRTIGARYKASSFSKTFTSRSSQGSSTRKKSKSDLNSERSASLETV